MRRPELFYQLGFCSLKAALRREVVVGGASTVAPTLSLSVFNLEVGRRGRQYQTDRASLSVPSSVEQQNSRLEPWYSYTHWFPMASSHVMKPSLEPVPKMQPAMMMFSSKYWARRGMSLDSAMFHHQQQRHTGGQMVRKNTFLLLLPHNTQSTFKKIINFLIM